ncbi:MAG: hypothetical protein JO125_05825, partial [Chloroflexi bacterium]|nr:hypothetical protein [Chloroflexota bacterium]
MVRLHSIRDQGYSNQSIPSIAQIGAGERLRRVQQLLRCALEHHPAALIAAFRP